MSVMARVHSTVNRALRPAGIQVVRGWSSDTAVQSFLSARKTLAAAERAGLSVTDYIDQFSAKPGARDWLPHLSKLPGFQLHDADGRT